MRKLNPPFFLLPLLFLFLSSPTIGQHWIKSRSGRAWFMTFETPAPRPVPDGYTEDSYDEMLQQMSEQLKKDKKKYEDIAVKKLHRIKRYFEVLTQPTDYQEKLEATKERLLRLFPNDQYPIPISYKGTYLDKNLNLLSRQTPLEQYVDDMIAYSQENQGLVNICWNIGLDSLSFQQPSGSASSPIGVLSGKLPEGIPGFKVSKDSSYHVYEAKGYIREDVSFFKNNKTNVIPICKEVVFTLRYLLVKKENSFEFTWVPFVRFIKGSRSGNCGGIKSVDCDSFPPPEDTSLYYRPLASKTFIVPGLGWKNPDKENQFPLWSSITVATAVGLGFGVYNKIRSDKYYKTHQQATTFRILDENYNMANKHNQQFIIFAGAGLAVWALSDGILFYNDRRQQRLFDRKFGGKLAFRPLWQVNPNGEIAFSLKCTLNL